MRQGRIEGGQAGATGPVFGNNPEWSNSGIFYGAHGDENERASELTSA